MPALPLEHPRQDGLDRINHAHDVDSDRLLDIGGIRAGRAGSAPETGVCDHDVDRPELVCQRFERGVKSLTITDIGDGGSDRAA